MPLVLLHPGLLGAVTLATNPQESQRVIQSLQSWSEAASSGGLRCHMSALAQLVLTQTNRYPTLPTFQVLHRRFGDGSWNPNLVFQAVFRLLAAPEMEPALTTKGDLQDWHQLDLNPSIVEDDLPSELAEVARHDVAMLAREQQVVSGDFAWVVAASSRHKCPDAFNVAVTGSIQVAGIAERVSVEALLRYALRPQAAEMEGEDEALFRLVRSRMEGRWALIIGGDGRDINESAISSILGLEQVRFLRHYDRGPGENIDRARHMLRSGNYSLYIHITKFGSHSPSNLKQDCPSGCHYVPVDGSPSIRNIARAIARTLRLGQ